MAEERSLEIVIPLFDKFTALDAVGPYEILHRLHNAKVHFVARQPGLYTADSGTLSLQATGSFESFPNPDVIVVPGGPVANVPLDDQTFLNYIKAAHQTSLYTTSVCTGGLLLAAAGILNGLQATTHWIALDRLKEWGAKPVSQRVVRQGKIITAAGVSSGIDMAIVLATALRGEQTAKIVQLLVEYDPQPPYDVLALHRPAQELAQMAESYNANA